MVRPSPNKLITRREIQLTKLTTLENRLTTQEHSTKSGWGREMGRESIRNRRATRPPAHFQRNPPGRGQLAVFPSGGCRTSRYGRFTASPARTALKNSQLIRRPPGDITIICDRPSAWLRPRLVRIRVEGLKNVVLPAQRMTARRRSRLSSAPSGLR